MIDRNRVVLAEGIDLDPLDIRVTDGFRTDYDRGRADGDRLGRNVEIDRNEVAQRLIAACRAKRADELDLGGLGLTELPAAEMAGLTWLKRLYLGLRIEYRQGIKQSDTSKNLPKSTVF